MVCLNLGTGGRRKLAILGMIVLRMSNGPTASINRRIKTVKVRCRGFQGEHRFPTPVIPVSEG